ncbi:MAG: hypothetical protein WBE26_17250 [Phycisphaerae bacterium]
MWYEEPDIFETIDTFMAAVPWDEHRMVLVIRREHGGRSYVRMRTWNRHWVKGCWYPSKRSFVIPLRNAEALAEAIRSAARGEPLGEKPEWYAEREREEAGEAAPAEAEMAGSPTPPNGSSSSSSR